MSDWSSEMVAYLKELHEEAIKKKNMSHTDMAIAINEKFNLQNSRILSRNAVIGKCNRLGMSNKGKLKEMQPHHKRKRKPDTEKKIKTVKAYQVAQYKALDDAVSNRTIKAVEEEPKHIDINQLTSDTCRWPFGNGPFTYCGCRAPGERPYCDYHTEVAKRPLEPKKKAA